MIRGFLLSILVVLPVAAGVYVLLGLVNSQPLPPNAFNQGGEPLIMAHRGGRSLGPENTLYTFSRAVELKVDVLEIDVRLTGDGAIVLVHDRTVDSTTGRSGRVDSFTLAELRKLDAGYRWNAPGDSTFPHRGQGLMIPTLEEVFASFPEQRFNIELKSDEIGLATAVCHAVSSFSMERQVLVASFQLDVVKAFRTACPDIPTAATGTEVGEFLLLSKLGLESAFQPHGQAFQVPIRYVDQGFMSAARNRNVVVHVWTVNNPDEMKLLLDLGVHGIITDFPQRMRKLL